MHPLDSSLDASLHGHGNNNETSANRTNKARRRTSLDNGYLTASNDLMMLISSSNNNAFHNYNSNSNNIGGMRGNSGSNNNNSNTNNNDYHDNYSRRGPRRLSLNNCTAMNTTFLASNNSPNYSVSTADKSDLDRDCHSWLDEDYNINNNSNSNISSNSRRSNGIIINSNNSFTSHVSRRASFDVGKNHHEKAAADAAAGVVTVSDGDYGADDGSSFDGSEDSFCEATGAEPANHEYMMKDLGASCFWHDFDFRTIVNPSVNHDHNHQPVESFNEMSADELDFQHNDNSNNSGNDDDPSCGGGTAVAGRILFHEQEGRERATVSHQKHGREEEDEILLQSEAIAEQQHSFDDDDDDMSSECDSFCDAAETERANKEYLKKDLGASCFWSSNDDLLVDMQAEQDDDDDDEAAEHTLNASICTITEEV